MTYGIQGQIYHTIGSVLPLPDEIPEFLQMYFIGNGEIELDLRSNLFNGIDRSILALSQDILHQFNIMCDHSRLPEIAFLQMRAG